MPSIDIRPERAADRKTVFRINELAFERPDEARLVEALREQARPMVSLVAEAEGRVAGHILFTPVEIEDRSRPDQLPAMGLAPMAVDPEFQRQGIGSQLVRAGLLACREIGQPAVFVLGHPEYYPRLGFRPAAPLGLHYQDHSFDHAFMVAELAPGALQGRRGWVRYLPAFEEV
ncbi:MAG: N-acetyltransferase [Acidobacteriota bacterium]